MTPEEKKIETEKHQKAKFESDRITDKKIDTLLANLDSARQQYVYYILAITAACIAFTVNATSNNVIDKNLIAAAIAILLWIFSFIFGVLQLHSVEKSLSNNIVSLKLSISNADKKIIKEMDKLYEGYKISGRKYRTLQMIFLVFGAAAFLYWHVNRLIVNTIQVKAVVVKELKLKK